MFGTGGAKNKVQNNQKASAGYRLVSGVVHIVLLVFVVSAFVIGIGYFAYKNSVADNLRNTNSSTQQAETASVYIDPSLVNPENDAQFAIKASNTYRKSVLDSLGRALRLYITEHNDIIPPEITANFRHISKMDIDLCFLTEKYISSLPIDPRIINDPNNKYNAGGYVLNCKVDYNTGFAVKKTSDNKIVLYAPLAEGKENITIIK